MFSNKPSLNLADKVLNELKSLESLKDIEITVGVFHNGREQGYTLEVLNKNGMNERSISFGRAKSSDSVVVYHCDFTFSELEGISQDFWNSRRCFSKVKDAVECIEDMIISWSTVDNLDKAKERVLQLVKEKSETRVAESLLKYYDTVLDRLYKTTNTDPNHYDYKPATIVSAEETASLMRGYTRYYIPDIAKATRLISGDVDMAIKSLIAGGQIEEVKLGGYPYLTVKEV